MGGTKMIDKELLKNVVSSLIDTVREYVISRAEDLPGLLEKTSSDFKPDDQPVNYRFILELYKSPIGAPIKSINAALTVLQTSQAKQYYSIFAYLHEFCLAASIDERYTEAFKALDNHDQMETSVEFIASFGALVLMTYYDDFEDFNDETMCLFANKWIKEGKRIGTREDRQDVFNRLLILTSSVVWSIMIRLGEQELVH
jgi:DNA primase large subunit